MKGIIGSMRKDWTKFMRMAAVASTAPLVFAIATSSAQAETTATSLATATGETVSLDVRTGGGDKVVSDEGGTTATAAGDSPSEAGDHSHTPVNRGDDALPTKKEIGESPYLRLATFNESGQESGAFIPPTVTKTSQAGLAAGGELREILGTDTFEKRVNITTPPDTDIADVVRLLSESANLNFVYGQNVITGKITLNLKDVPLGTALQAVLSANDLVLVREGDNVLRIVPRKSVQGSSVETRTIYVKLNWVPADAMRGTLEKLQKTATGGAQAAITAHVESNTIIITDTPQQVSMLRDVISQLDVPEKQVMIEARLVEMIQSNDRELGSITKIETRDNTGNSLANGGTEDNPIAVQQLLSLLPGSEANPAISFGTAVSIFGREFNIASTLDGLEQLQLANILATPRIITLNNQQAIIDIIRKIPYVEAEKGESGNTITNSVKFEEVGVKLTVNPTITNNNFVRMKLEPEQRILASFQDTINGAVPVVDTRAALTNVIVKDEDTVVLGGLRQIDATQTTSAYPWLGKAPVIGWFFKRDGKTHRKNDLMLFVTPTIVKAPQLTVAENYMHSRIDAHWDLPDYFFDDSVTQRESRHKGSLNTDTRNYYPQNLTLPTLDQSGSGDGK